MNTIKIGKLAKACDVNIDTVRYYERKGLISPLERTGSGYRVYDQDSIKRLNFIRRTQSLGFTLEEIKELLELSELPEKDCEDIREKAQEKITEIEKRISDLTEVKSALGELSEFCPGKGKPLSECSILKHLYGEAG